MTLQIFVNLKSDSKLTSHTKSEPAQLFIHTKSEQVRLVHTFTAMCN